MQSQIRNKDILGHFLFNYILRFTKNFKVLFWMLKGFLVNFTFIYFLIEG